MEGMWLMALMLALPPWSEPTAIERVEGLATFYGENVMEQVAAYRGYDGPREPVAVMACGDLGRDVVLVIDGHWIPAHVVDCARRDHYADRVAEGKVVELSWSLWRELDLPLAPVPAEVWFDLPWVGGESLVEVSFQRPRVGDAPLAPVHL